MIDSKSSMGGQRARIVMLFLGGAALGACERPADRPESPGAFTDITADVGLSGPPLDGWPDGTFDLREIMGGGVAVLDFDDDGDLDIYQVRLGTGAAAHDRLFARQPDGRYADVTDEAGVRSPGYGQGVAVGDVNNDGKPDIYVANYGKDTFLLNAGDGSFADRTDAAGLGGEGWSVSATFTDYDADGDLDLFVVRYLAFFPGTVCRTEDGAQDYCGPANFDGVTDLLYRNDGQGNFTDASHEAGITRPGKGLGVVAADLTGDGLTDFYVANDGEANYLWVNTGNHRFSEEALMRGVAVNASGEPEASMGVALGDADGDARPDLFMTHLEEETNTLYRADDMMLYQDKSGTSGFGRADFNLTGFGCAFVDHDHDGSLDLVVANGRVKRGPAYPAGHLGTFWNQLGEPDLLLVNDGAGRFTEAGEAGGDFTKNVLVSRGLALGDLDGDGDQDLVLGHVAGLGIYRNDAGSDAGHWLRIRAREQGRDALGAVVTARTGGREVLRLLLAGYSYASSSEPVAHFGLGESTAVEWVDVRWPDGTRERFPVPGVDVTLTLTRGDGDATP